MGECIPVKIQVLLCGVVTFLQQHQGLRFAERSGRRSIGPLRSGAIALQLFALRIEGIVDGPEHLRFGRCERQFSSDEGRALGLDLLQLLGTFSAFRLGCCGHR